MSPKVRDLKAGDRISAPPQIDDYGADDYSIWTIISNEAFHMENKITMTDGKETVESFVSPYWEICLVED